MSRAWPISLCQQKSEFAMSRLFVGNFDFEHRLCEPTHEPAKTLKRLNAELATSWLSIANDGDWLWTPEPVDAEFFQRARHRGLPNVFPLTSLSEVSSDVTCIPWGWSPEVRKLVDQFGWVADAPPDSAVRYANSRATSDHLEREWGVGLPESRRVDSLDDAKAFVRSLTSTSNRWVAKAQFGMSARERILGRGSMTVADENWVRHRLKQQGVVFFEPWVDRIDEFGVQIDVLAEGEPILIGITPMLVDANGQYAGSWFSYHESRFAASRSLWPSTIEVVLCAAKQLQSHGYFGPLGIDAMVYRAADGSTRVRPLQDINARWTMGRLSLGLRRLLDAGEEGCWLFGGSDNPEIGLIVSRCLEMAPQQIGGALCRRSRVLIGRSS